MISLELTPEIKEWLDTPPDQRDYDRGALLVGKVTRNRILMANLSRDPKAKASTIEYHLRKIYSKRLADITHGQVGEMLRQCDKISRSIGLPPLTADSPVSTGSAGSPESPPHPPLPSCGQSHGSAFQKGKRADHDELPPEIQKLWVDNGEIRLRMRECHTHIRLINATNSTCPDSDRFPWAKQLIAYDKQYRDNWNRYDHYIKGSDPLDTKLAVDPRTESKNAAKTANMLLGKYALNPDPKTAGRIKDAYAKVISPTVNLTEKMRAANLL